MGRWGNQVGPGGRVVTWPLKKLSALVPVTSPWRTEGRGHRSRARVEASRSSSNILGKGEEKKRK